MNQNTFTDASASNGTLPVASLPAEPPYTMGVGDGKAAGGDSSKHTNKMNITSSEVTAWMREQLAKAHEFSNYASITVRLVGFHDSDKITDYSIYLGQRREWSGPSIEHCFARMEASPPKSELEVMAEEIDALTEKRDALIAANANKNQPSFEL